MPPIRRSAVRWQGEWRKALSEIDPGRRAQQLPSAFVELQQEVIGERPDRLADLAVGVAVLVVAAQTGTQLVAAPLVDVSEVACRGADRVGGLRLRPACAEEPQPGRGEGLVLRRRAHQRHSDDTTAPERQTRGA